MLNITDKSVEAKILSKEYSAFGQIYHPWLSRALVYWLVGILGLFILVLFLPWTQNITTNGQVTNLRPDQRAQDINSIIDGRIEKWFVKEGEFVNKGDTILQLSEIKDAYFDPDLLKRTQAQISAKEQSLQSYEEKAKALANQIGALQEVMRLKLEQTTNKIEQTQFKLEADSIAYVTEQQNFDIAQKQLTRVENLNKEGIKSALDVEKRRLKIQEVQNKLNATKNKLLSTRNELINAKIELNSVRNQYNDKLSKAESDRFSALSSAFTASADLNKLQNQYSNYSIRRSLYFVTAPQNGYITQAIKNGVGETVKQGDAMMTFIPSTTDLAVELYVKAIDLPLFSVDDPVQLQFDGWPVLVFNGWPNIYFGMFQGKVTAIDNITSKSGEYRILVAPDTTLHEWPKQLRLGSGAQGIALLNQVPVWYELWRNLNGFPPDFYTALERQEKAKKVKKPKVKIK